MWFVNIKALAGATHIDSANTNTTHQMVKGVLGKLFKEWLLFCSIMSVLYAALFCTSEVVNLLVLSQSQLRWT